MGRQDDRIANLMIAQKALEKVLSKIISDFENEHNVNVDLEVRRVTYTHISHCEFPPKVESTLSWHEFIPEDEQKIMKQITLR